LNTAGGFWANQTPKTKSKLASIDDLDRFARMTSAIPDVKSWRALLATK